MGSIFMLLKCIYEIHSLHMNKRIKALRTFTNGFNKESKIVVEFVLKKYIYLNLRERIVLYNNPISKCLQLTELIPLSF